MKTLGDKIRYYRNLNGWSQVEFADKLNITILSVSNIERNVTDLNYSRMKQIASLFKITVPELTDLSITPVEHLDYKKALIEKDKRIIKLEKELIKLSKNKMKIKKR